MTMTIPTLPSLPAGYVPTATDMNNLSYCCTFLLGKPLARSEDTAGGQAISTGGTVINFATKRIDTDGMWASGNPGRLTIQTPGFYKLRYGVAVGSSTNVVTTAVQCTYGSNNPGGTGNQSGTYWEGYAVPFSAVPQGTPGASGVWPFYLYAGDYLQVTATANASGDQTSILNSAGSFFALELVSI